VEEIGQSFQPRLALESAFLKIIEAGNVVSVTTLLGHFDELLSGMPQVPGQITPSPPADTRSGKENQQDATLPEPGQNESVKPFAAPDVSKPEEIRESTSSATAPDEEGGPIPKTDTAPSDSRRHPRERDVRRDWLAFTEYVKDRILWMSKDLQRADSARQQGEELHLHYSDPANCALLRTKENRVILTEFVLDFFQKELKVRFILPSDEEKMGGVENDRPQKQRHRLANDPQVQIAVDVFNGQVGDIRIGPRSR
jgi:DNA polymerase-3 subunit gamma/tau